MVNIVFLDEKVVGVFKDPEDAFQFIGDSLDKDSSNTNYRVEEFIVK